MTVGQLLDEAIAVIEAQGFVVRYDHLGGSGSGHCQYAGTRWMIFDVAQPIDEQLEAVVEAIASRPLPDEIQMSDELSARCERGATAS